MIFNDGKTLYEHIVRSCKKVPSWEELPAEMQEHYADRSTREYVVKPEAVLPKLNEWKEWFRNGRPPELEDNYVLNVLLRVFFRDGVDKVNKEGLVKQGWAQPVKANEVIWENNDESMAQVGFYRITSYGELGAEAEEPAKINLKNKPNMEDE